MNIKPLTIYLAGKVSKNDWRHEIVHDLRSHYFASGDEYPETWPVMKYAIFGEHHYSGPHPLADDHGCYHGPNTHGVAAGGDIACTGDPGIPRENVARSCLNAINTSDLVIAYITHESAYGTLCEIGYASAIGKPIYLSGPHRFPDYWFAEHLPNVSAWQVHATAESAVRQAISLHTIADPSPRLENPRNKFVYLLKAGHDLFKIGVSSSVSDRVKQLQTANPHPIEIIHYVESRDFLGLESHLHGAMQSKRASGEWFRLSPIDVETVRSSMDEWNDRHQNVTTLLVSEHPRTSLRDRVRGIGQVQS